MLFTSDGQALAVRRHRQAFKPNLRLTPSHVTCKLSIRTSQGCDNVDYSEDETRLSAPWIAVLIVLALALLVGVALYFRMSAPLNEPSKKGVGGAPAPSQTFKQVGLADDRQARLSDELQSVISGMRENTMLAA